MFYDEQYSLQGILVHCEEDQTVHAVSNAMYVACFVGRACLDLAAAHRDESL